MNKNMNKKDKGSALVLLTIIIALITVMGSAALSLTFSYFQIKKSYSEIRRSFYMSEKGLDAAYSNCHEVIKNAVCYSLPIAEDYLELYPSEMNEAESVFKENYKLYILNHMSEIKSTYNPSIEISNEDALAFTGESLTADIASCYISEKDVKQSVGYQLVVKVPMLSDVSMSTENFTFLISTENWSIIK
jgi:hypothetical protein